MALDPGMKIGPYTIVAPIGAGGMGEVYRATDSRLRRDVAIKVLPPNLAGDTERLARFEREAQVLAALNHPNIAGIHGFEESGEIRCLVLELVEGETLEERIARGPVPVDETIDIGRQIAFALEAAHEKGIIHRDLKPSNIKFSRDGTVKVLDFGLAKAIQGDPASGSGESQDHSASPTISGMGTRDGVILGTAAYMSPEQARGKPLDRRTDIWSFGCVLYECLVGKGLFAGETTTDILSSILQREPDWPALPPQTPPRLRDLLERCLEKDLKNRLRDAGDARLEMDRAATRGNWGGAYDVASTPSARRGLWAVALAAGAVMGALATWVLVPSTDPIETRTSLAQVERLTHDPGISEWPTWSPDGSLLAFTSNRSGNFEIYVRRVEGGQEVNVTEDGSEDFQPSFSPDGDSIAFVSTRSSRTGMIKIGATFGFEFRTFGGDIWVVPALGGRARRLATDGNFPVWHPGGDSIAYVSGPESHRSVMEMSSEGGKPRPVLDVDASEWEIVRIKYTPDGEGITFEDVEGQIFYIDRQDGAPRPLMKGTSHVWDPSGERLHYLVRDPHGGTRLQTAGFDPARREAGEPQTVGLMTGILRDLAIAKDGTHLAVSELEGSLNLTLLSLDDKGARPVGEERTLSPGQVIDRYPSFSPDGRRIAFASDRLGAEQIWVLDIETGETERLRLPGEDLGVNLPYWTQDGRHLIVTRFFPDGSRAMWQVAIDGSTAEEILPQQDDLFGGPVSPDGRDVLYSVKGERYRDLRAFDLETRQEHVVLELPADLYGGAWSPDGRELAFMSNATGALQIWRTLLTGDGEPEQLTSSEERIRHIFYSPDGQWIYFQPSHQNIYRMPASGGEADPVTSFPASGLFIEEPTLSPDGRSLAYCRSNGGASLWLLRIDR